MRWQSFALECMNIYNFHVDPEGFKNPRRRVAQSDLCPTRETGERRERETENKEAEQCASCVALVANNVR